MHHHLLHLLLHFLGHRPPLPPLAAPVPTLLLVDSEDLLESPTLLNPLPPFVPMVWVNVPPPLYVP